MIQVQFPKKDKKVGIFGSKDWIFLDFSIEGEMNISKVHNSFLGENIERKLDNVVMISR